MHVLLDKVSARPLFYLTLFCFAPQWMAQAGSWSAGPCGADGFCTMIAVQSEVEQRVPQNSGVVVGTIGDDGFKPAPVAQLTAKKICRKEVRVPRVVQDAVTRMFASVIDRGGPQALPASLTPSEQTMLLYYNTIIQQTMNFQCGNN